MEKELTKEEIIKKLPKFKKGNFSYYLAKAGISHVGMRPCGNKKRPHIMEYLYPSDSVVKILSVMEKG